jgi:hypothetical protein
MRSLRSFPTLTHSEGSNGHARRARAHGNLHMRIQFAFDNENPYAK